MAEAAVVPIPHATKVIVVQLPYAIKEKVVPITHVTKVMVVTIPYAIKKYFKKKKKIF